MDEPRTTRHASVIAMLNRKGGVGKTSLCFHLSGALAAVGKKVLLVDFDPQANLTDGFFGKGYSKSLHPQATALSVFAEHVGPTAEQIITETGVEGVSIVPGHTDLEDHDETRPAQRGEEQFMLRYFLEDIRDQFDVILVDCNPSLKLLSWNALVAADHVIVPLQPEDFGAHGMTDMQQVIDAVVEGPNRKLRLLGYVLNMVSRLKLHELFEKFLRSNYPNDVFGTSVPKVAHYAEAVTHQQPVKLYKKRSKAAKVMDALAVELLERVEVIRATPPRYLYPGNINGTDHTVATPESELRKAV